MAILVFCTCPDKKFATKLARNLVTKKLAACVNIVAGVIAIYSWQDNIEQTKECMLIIKTTKAKYEALAKAILKQHPYELPEIIAIPITQGLPAYIKWLYTATKTSE